ncbi:MAG: hypothetical protein AAFY99_02660 [Pseudomonadota bacterium]
MTDASLALQNKRSVKAYLDALSVPSDDGFKSAVLAAFAEDAEVHIVHPYNDVCGAAAYAEEFFGSLNAAFADLHRRDYILMGGEFQGDDWISSTGYYVGQFQSDWLGIKATQKLAYIRVGEFHRMEAGKIRQSYVFLDIPELMIACGQWPDLPSPASIAGYTGMIPGPATSDGILMEQSDAEQSAISFDMVVAMLRGLATPDEAWRPYWHDTMMWYGPGAFGSFVGLERFRAFQVPFEARFDGWSGGAANNGMTAHFTRFGDCNYVCSGGWPSLTGVQVGEFLGQAPTNKRLFMRVCDWWRRDGDRLLENWVFVDIPHVLLQMGYDLFGELEGNGSSHAG